MNYKIVIIFEAEGGSGSIEIEVVNFVSLKDIEKFTQKVEEATHKQLADFDLEVEYMNWKVEVKK